MTPYDRETLELWIAHSEVQDLEIQALRNELLRLRELAFELWLELMAQTKERIRAE